MYNQPGKVAFGRSKQLPQRFRQFVFFGWFFLFSGFEEIVETIGDKKLRSLVFVDSELNYDESSIVDPELPGIISREDYEKAGVEELAEWKK
ncbi:MAG: hypothetical protein K0B11_17200 [Mariniphaga sp.]|nr:hypothetical protein [Mariniphaga sp.]